MDPDLNQAHSYTLVYNPGQLFQIVKDQLQVEKVHVVDYLFLFSLIVYRHWLIVLLRLPSLTCPACALEEVSVN